MANISFKEENPQAKKSLLKKMGSLSIFGSCVYQVI